MIMNDTVVHSMNVVKNKYFLKIVTEILMAYSTTDRTVPPHFFNKDRSFYFKITTHFQISHHNTDFTTSQSEQTRHRQWSLLEAYN